MRLENETIMLQQWIPYPVSNTQPSLDYPTQIAGLLFGSFWLEFTGKIWASNLLRPMGTLLIIESWVAICCSFVIAV